MARKATKRDVEANQLIQNLVGQGKRLTEIMETLSTSGYRTIKPGRVSYYITKKDRVAPTVKTAGTAITAGARVRNVSTTGINFARIKSILNADFLTDDDRTMLIKKEVSGT